MSSVVTNDFRRSSLELLKNDIETGASNYYIGLARSDDSAPSIVEANSLFSQNQVRQTLQGIKKLVNVSFVIPTVEWRQGEIYNAYSDKDYDQERFYVVNSFNEVFVCVEQPVNEFGEVQITGIEEPTAALAGNTGITFETSDGYRWRYMYKISNLAYAQYHSRSFIPVKSMTDVSIIPEEDEQYTLQLSAVDGEIIGIEFDSGGAGQFSTTPTITISGNGTDASFSVITGDSDQIVAIKVDSDGTGQLMHGSGYDYATATLSSGSVNIRPILAPNGGLNADPVKSLKAKALIAQVDIQGDENGALISQNDFSQVVIIKNPKVYGSDSDFILGVGNALKSFDGVSAGGLPLLDDRDEIIYGDTSGARAKLFYQDDVNGKFYFFQDDETGYDEFTVGESVIGEISQNFFTTSAINDPDVDPFSGEILYINNLENRIDRSLTQSEDIRIVIQLG